MAERFFQLLKRERIKRKTYKYRITARQDIFNYIEMFYNLVRHHGFNDDISPVEFEKQYAIKQVSRILVTIRSEEIFDEMKSVAKNWY